MDFRIKQFQQLLNALQKKSYSFQTLAEFINSPKPKAIVLRHDVDKLPVNSLHFSRIQAEMGIKGSYYFRAVPQSWDENIIKEVANLGHEVGYHYETMDTSKGNIDQAWDEFKHHLDKLRKLVHVETICMHGSPLSKWDNRNLWDKYNYGDLNITAEPYFDVDWNEVYYLTDTGRRWDGENVSIRDKVIRKKNSKYFHITSNNTIYGTQIHVMPKIESAAGFLVADMSSDILSRPIDVTDFGLIYAGAQKNMGPAGVTMVIIRDDLMGKGHREIPTMLDYETHAKKESMFNTPPVLSVFAVNETLKWIDGLGGLDEMLKINRRKSDKVYQEIERNSLFMSTINVDDRSMMNIPFIFIDRSMDDNEFLSFCDERGLKTLKGHRSVGGFRASVYNAMPEEGVDALIFAMQEYERSK